MEFYLIDWRDDGEICDRVAFFALSLTDMGQIDLLNDLVNDQIIDRIYEEASLSNNGVDMYLPMAFTRNGFGAEIRVVRVTYDMLAKQFGAIVRDSIAMIEQPVSTA